MAVEVLAGDQERINRFRNLNTQCSALRLELGKLEQRREEYEGLGETLELAELEHSIDAVPYALGTAFTMLPIAPATREAERDAAEMGERISTLRATLGEKRTEMAVLRGELYAKFGRENINLGEDE